MKGIHITLSLQADTPDELSVLTVRAQILWGMELDFFDFTQVKSGKYICWFKIPQTIYQMRVNNGQTSSN